MSRGEYFSGPDYLLSCTDPENSVKGDYCSGPDNLLSCTDPETFVKGAHCSGPDYLLSCADPENFVWVGGWGSCFCLLFFSHQSI